MTGDEMSPRPDAARSIETLPSIDLQEGVVDSWCFSLRAPHADVVALRNRLSPDEWLRAARFRFERDRVRFIVARATTRELLGRYADVAPVDLRFGQGPYGKPDLRSATGRRLRFNVSHTSDVMLVAVARDFEVGIDVEGIDPDLEHVTLARHCFAPKELERVIELRGGRRATMFSAIWTLKEAFIKAIGTGLSAKLDSFDVCTALQPGVPPVPIKAPSTACAWWARRAGAPANCTAAVAAARSFQLRLRTTIEPAPINGEPAGAAS